MLRAPASAWEPGNLGKVISVRWFRMIFLEAEQETEIIAKVDGPRKKVQMGYYKFILTLSLTSTLTHTHDTHTHTHTLYIKLCTQPKF